MANGWLEAIAKTPGLTEKIHLVGLVDLDRSTAEKLAEKHELSSVAIGTDLDVMLAELRPDLVFDVAVPGAREEIVSTALSRGCHVLSEKPMATSLEAARRLVEAADAAGRIHAVVQNRRYHPDIRRMREMLESGVLGKLNAIHCDFFIGAHFGGFREDMDNVLLIDMAIHTLDAARYISGQQPLAVYCYENNPESSWYRHGSSANAIFEFTDDVVITYRGSWCAEGANTSWDAGWRIIGSKGTLLWDGAEKIEASIVDGDEGFLRPVKSIDIPPPQNDAQTHGHASVLLDFVRAIEAGSAPETVGSDNIKSLAMVFGAIESARAKKRVEINV